MPLTDTQLKSIKPKTKTSKIFDSKGLYVEITPQGSKRWRFKYRFGGKEKLISLGLYPEIPLKLARERRDDARKMLANGVNPSDHRKAEKSAVELRSLHLFEPFAIEWMNKFQDGWTESHKKTVHQRLCKNVFPFLGSMSIVDITPPDLLKVLRRVEARGALETAHRIRGIFGQIFRFAVANGIIASDPSRDLRGALPPVKNMHLAAVTKPKEVAVLLYMLEGYQGSPVVSAALRFAPLVFVRPGELRQAEWIDIDFDAAQWSYTVTKTTSQHIVPLSKQAIDILKEIQPLTGRGRYVFPGARASSRPMSNNAVLAAMRSLGISKEKMCGHGFRAIARTLLDEVLQFPPHLIEHQLAHAVRDPHGRAYNRTQHLHERRIMMQKWADYLEELKQGVGNAR